MIKQSFTLSVTMLILSFLCPAFLNAQIVTDERIFSFEEPQLPACITGVSLGWAYPVHIIKTENIRWNGPSNRTGDWNSGKT